MEYVRVAHAFSGQEVQSMKHVELNEMETKSEQEMPLEEMAAVKGGFSSLRLEDELDPDEEPDVGFRLGGWFRR